MEKVKSTSDTAIKAVCPTSDPRFSLVNGKCLLFVNDTKNQNEAKLDCENQFARNTVGRLYEPRDATMNNLVYEEAKIVFGKDDYLWLGIEDRSAENQWSYSSSGQNVSTMFWNSGQPDGSASSDQDCVRTGKVSDGVWNDIACSSSYRYICEFEDRTLI
mgnify:CR=1 FL=1